MGLPQGTEISSLSGCTSIPHRQILIKEEGLTVTTCLGYEDISKSELVNSPAEGGWRAQVLWCANRGLLSAQVALVQ